MQEVSVIIPNYNGMAYLEGVLSSLEQQEFQNFETILVDNGSSDGSVAFTMGNYPWVHIIELPDNFGFSRAVNEGIYAARAPYVLLLNNDTEVDRYFVGEMLAAIKRHRRAAIMTGTSWMMLEIITAPLAGLLPGEKARMFTVARVRTKFSPPVQGLLYIGRKYSRRLVILMRSTLHIWRISMWATGRESKAMRTGMPQKQSCII